MYKPIIDALNEQRNKNTKSTTNIDESEKIAWNKVHSTHGGETRSVYEKGGRTYQTYIFNTESEANNFLKKNKGFGIIGQNGYQIHIARLSAKGRVTNQQKTDGTVKEDVDLMEALLPSVKKDSETVIKLPQIVELDSNLSKAKAKIFDMELVFNRYGNTNIKIDIIGKGKHGRGLIGLMHSNSGAHKSALKKLVSQSKSEGRGINEEKKES